MILLPDGRRASFISESGSPEPLEVTPIGDSTRGAVALKMIRAGKALLWTGDFLNGRALLQTLGRRLKKERSRPRTSATAPDLAARWRCERANTRARSEVLGQVLVTIEPSGEVALRRAPTTARAVELAWGPSECPRLVSLGTLGGALSAAEWTTKGLLVPGLEGKITPLFGVFSPTRRAYVDLLAHLEVQDRTVLDVGTGTGALAFVLLQRGATRAVGTDLEERAVRCASANARALGLETRYRAIQTDLFPQAARFDWVLFNAPWIPETPRTGLDRAVFDEGGETLKRFLNAAPTHLNPDGQVALIVSDLPVRLGLTGSSDLQHAIESAGLAVVNKEEIRASHGGSRDARDPLHGARSAERIHLLVLRPAKGRRSASPGRASSPRR